MSLLFLYLVPLSWSFKNCKANVGTSFNEREKGIFMKASKREFMKIRQRNPCLTRVSLYVIKTCSLLLINLSLTQYLLKQSRNRSGSLREREISVGIFVVFVAKNVNMTDFLSSRFIKMRGEQRENNIKRLLKNTTQALMRLNW